MYAERKLISDLSVRYGVFDFAAMTEISKYILEKRVCDKCKCSYQLNENEGIWKCAYIKEPFIERRTLIKKHFCSYWKPIAPTVGGK